MKQERHLEPESLTLILNISGNVQNEIAWQASLLLCDFKHEINYKIIESQMCVS